MIKPGMVEDGVMLTGKEAHIPRVMIACLGMVLGFELYTRGLYKDAIGSHAVAPLEASKRVTNSIPLGGVHFLTG
jgi:hypothetical protein